MSYVIISSSSEPELVTSLIPQKFPFTLPINAQHNSMIPVEGEVVLTFKQKDVKLNEIKIRLHPGSFAYLDTMPIEIGFLGDAYKRSVPIDVYWQSSHSFIVMGYELKDR